MRWALLALALAGCGPTSPIVAPTTSTPPTTQGGGTPQKSDPTATLPQTLEKRHGQRSAAEWGRDLLDTGNNGRISVEASLALYEIGEEGLRFALPALKSELAGIRRNGLESIHPTAAAKHPAAMTPPLVAMLSDTVPSNRGYAALVIARSKLTGGLESLKAALEKESDKEAKRQMAEAVKLLEMK